MTRLNNQELLKEFPFLKPYEHNPEYLNPDTDTWMTGMPEGWYELLIEMFREIKQILIENDFLEDYRIDQLKEKFGTIRLYDNTDLTHDIINKYEIKSSKICAQCGKPATVCTSGWITYLCDECFSYRQKVIEEWNSNPLD